MTRMPLGRVLVVDDEHDIRTMLEIVLAMEGWDVEQAPDGSSALERCAESEFDVVVLDHRMPGLTGMEVARELVARDYDASLVLFSAYVNPLVEAECRALGVAVVDKVDWYGLVETCRIASPIAA